MLTNGRRLVALDAGELYLITIPYFVADVSCSSFSGPRKPIIRRIQTFGSRARRINKALQSKLVRTGGRRKPPLHEAAMCGMRIESKLIGLGSLPYTQRPQKRNRINQNKRSIDKNSISDEENPCTALYVSDRPILLQKQRDLITSFNHRCHISLQEAIIRGLLNPKYLINLTTVATLDGSSTHP